MEKENYPLYGSDAEKPSQEEPPSFDLYNDESEHDKKYLEAILDSNPEAEKSQTEKRPEATEDQSY